MGKSPAAALRKEVLATNDTAGLLRLIALLLVELLAWEEAKDD